MTRPGNQGATPRLPFAAAPVLAIAGLMLLTLLVLAPAYGFHRDELYFVVAGRHPALGYDDQPPFAPLVSAAAVAILGPNAWAVRILPAVAVAAVAVLAAAITRELGGRSRAQVLAALVLAVSGYLAAGHLGVTATYDLLAWALVLWLVARILGDGDPRLWLAVGTVAGVGLWNKHLVLFLGFGLAVGLLVHRRDQLRTPWPWLGGLLALVIWLPNLAWQVANGLPQLEMARRIGATEGGDRAMLLVELLLLVGPLLFPVAIAGLWQLLRSESLRPFRALGTSFLAILAAVLLVGGKSYYVIGAVPPLMAAGAIALDRWLGRGRLRMSALAGATVGSAAIIALLTLPVLPAATLAQTPIPEIYRENAETVGWPELVATVEDVATSLPDDERARAVVLTANYGEAGSLEVLGAELPPVYSGHNAFARWGPPPEALDVGILVGWADPQARSWLFDRCTQVATIENPAGLPNQELGRPVHVCTGRRLDWSEAWDRIRHLD